MLALILCCAMLAGTTLAWFTDSASSGVNTIQAGNLDIEVSYRTSDDAGNVIWKPIQDEGSLFSTNLWEPGHTEFVTLKVENKGTLALKYKMIVSPISESGGINVAGSNFKLSDYLVFKTIDNGTTDPAYTSRDDVRTAAGTTLKLTQSNLTQPNTTMEPGSGAQYVTLAVYMPEDVGNAANHKTGTPAPFITLGITVLATQVDSEEDSFGPDYDAGVDYSNADRLVYSYTEPISLSDDLTKDESGTVFSSSSNIEMRLDTVTIKSGDTAVSVPTDVLDEGDHTLSLNVTKSNSSGNFTVPDGQGAVHYDVTPMLDGKELDTANAAPNGKYYIATLPVGSSLQNVKIFHDDVELSNQPQTDGTTEYFQYDSNTGIATIYVKHFSPFSATFDAVAQIGNTYYGTLYEAVSACKSSETIKLLGDITLDKANATYGGWANCATGTLNGTLDGNNHTITLGEDLYLGTYFGSQFSNSACLKNVKIVANNGSAYVQAYRGLFENVKISGSIEVSNNTGAFVIYGSPYYGALTFRNCEMAATMYGEGTAKNYNAAFVGYGLGTGVQFNFDDCKMTGSLTCGVAAVFLGNDSQLKGNWKVNVSNFTFGEDAVVRNTLTSGYNWKFNGIVAANAAYGTPVVIIDGTSYSGTDGFTQLVDAKNTIWDAKHFAYGPQDASLKLVKNTDGTFTITPATNDSAVKYVVTLAVYSTLKEGGSGLQSVKETITLPVEGTMTTQLKDLKFIDATWLANNTAAVESTLAGNTIYTLDGVSYYMITDNELCTLNGTPKSAQIYGVTAYDASGNIVASAPLSN